MTNKELKRIILINDLASYGKCALSVAIPVISACGFETVPVPTAILSTNTKFPGFQVFDTTEYLMKFLNHLDDLDVKTDAVLTGFLGSFKQVEIITEYLSGKECLKIVDPIMGDGGKIYKTYTGEMVEGMKSLVSAADIVTPNLTEACALSNTEYKEITTEEECAEISGKIRNLGAKTVIITGVIRNGKLYNCISDKNGYREQKNNLLDFLMSGTGDLFSSVMAAKYMKGNNIDCSVKSAADFVAFIMGRSREFEGFEDRGPCFEPYLHLLSE